MTNYKYQIEQELKRLGCDTDRDPYSGLMAEETDESGIISIFDDHARGNYEAKYCLNVLQNTSQAYLHDDHKTIPCIWHVIAEAEV